MRIVAQGSITERTNLELTSIVVCPICTRLHDMPFRDQKQVPSHRVIRAKIVAKAILSMHQSEQRTTVWDSSVVVIARDITRIPQRKEFGRANII